MNPQEQRKTSRLAVASFILSLFGPMSLFAFPLALISLVRIRMSRDRLKGMVYSILGLLVCVVWLLFSVFVVNPEVKLWAEFEKTNTCRYNLRILGDTIRRYAAANGGRLPDANQWCDQLLEFDKRLSKSSFKHPKVEYGECNFAFNTNIGGQILSTIPRDTVMVFEADGVWNLNGNDALFNNTSHDLYETETSNNTRSNLYRHVLLVDGSIKEYWLSEKGIRSWWNVSNYRPLQWKP